MNFKRILLVSLQILFIVQVAWSLPPYYNPSDNKVSWSTSRDNATGEIEITISWDENKYLINGSALGEYSIASALIQVSMDQDGKAVYIWLPIIKRDPQSKWKTGQEWGIFRFDKSGNSRLMILPRR